MHEQKHQQEAAAAPSSVAVACLAWLLLHEKKDWTDFESLHKALASDGQI
jgi:hypothetical protein